MATEQNLYVWLKVMKMKFKNNPFMKRKKSQVNLKSKTFFF